MSIASAEDPRLAELAANLAAVRRRISAACTACGRDVEEVTLVAVTKTFPAADVRRLAELGLVDVGESRDQEARPKVTELADLALRWHFVGRLQRNKARSVAGYAHLVHAVDRPELLVALEQTATDQVATDQATTAQAGGQRPDRPLAVLIQVNLDPDPEHAPTPDQTRTASRGGAAPAEVAALADAAAGCQHLRLAGLMAIAPRAGDPDRAFARLAEVAARVRAEHPAATVLSAGMSGDLEAAIRHGATHLRVGTALLGSRATLVR